MNKNDILRSLQKELQKQEKLKKDIAGKTAELNQSKTQSMTYRKWLKKLERLEQNQIRRKEEIEKKMQDALMQKKDSSLLSDAQEPICQKKTVQVQKLFDAENTTNTYVKI